MKEQWKKGWQGVFPMLWETGETEVKVAHYTIFSNRKRTKLWKPLRKWDEPGIKGGGSRKFNCPTCTLYLSQPFSF